MSLHKTTERFSKLKHPVHKITAKTPDELFDQLPGLRRFFQRVTVDKISGQPVSRNKTPEGTVGSHFFNTPEDLVKFIKYTVFVYNPDSDLVTDYGELRQRKEAAAIEAGWNREVHGDWPVFVEEILSMKNRVSNQHILDYLKILKSNLWMEIVQLQEDIDYMNEVRMRDRALAIKENYSDKVKDSNEKLQVNLKKFYAEHNDLKNATVKDIFPISPENFYKELEVDEEWFKVRQVSDVSK
jgi:hypothetical protein